MKQYIGIDIGGTFIKYGIVNQIGEIVFSGKRPTRRLDPSEVIEDLTEIIRFLMKEFTLNEVGISIPGVITPDNKMLTSGALQRLTEWNIQEELVKRTGASIGLVNDANAVAYAEAWVGAATNCQNFVCLPLGTGVGGAIFWGGKVVTGRIGAAGEFGMSLLGLGQTNPVGYESASFYCGAIAGLCRMYNQKKGNLVYEKWETDVRQILKAADEGEKEAVEALKAFYEQVAVLLVNIAVSLDPEKILIGGGISENYRIMEGILAAVEKLRVRYVDMTVLGFPEVVCCQTGNHAGIIGAVAHIVAQSK